MGAFFIVGRPLRLWIEEEKKHKKQLFESLLVFVEVVEAEGEDGEDDVNDDLFPIRRLGW